MQPPPPDTGARESSSAFRRQDGRHSRTSSKTAFAADAEDLDHVEREEPQQPQEQKPPLDGRATLAEWMHHLDTKLDAVLELVAKSSHERPKLSRQHSRVTLRSSRVSVDTCDTARRRPLMRELLERGRRAVSEEAAEMAERSSRRASTERRASTTAPMPLCEEQGAGHGSCRRGDDDDDDEVRQPRRQATTTTMRSTSLEDLDTQLSPKTTASGSLSIREKSEAAAAAAQAEHAQRFKENTAQLNRKLQKRVTSIRKRSTRSSSSSLEHIMAVNGKVGSSKKCSVRTVVTSPQFDTCVTVLIVCNVFLIGAQVQDHATSSESPPWFGYMGHVFTGLFTAELLARMYVHRLEVFSSPTEGSWNLFDMFLVLISWVDLCLVLISMNALPESATFISKLGRTVRIVRILRIIRTVRFCNQLRIILKQLVSSLQSLFWVFVILVAMIYAVAIIITQNAADYLIIEAPLDSGIDTGPLRQCFGNLFDTMYTLFQCISGGRSWGEVSILMRGPGWVSEALVILYVFFSVFAVANIVNGVFVDGAIELAKRDRMNMIDKQRAENADKERHLVDLLMAIDVDGDNTISYDEWLLALERSEIREYIAALQVETVDTKALFSLLDTDGSGHVNVGEFVTGMMTLQGEAKSIDVHMLLYENKRLASMMCGMMDFVYERFGDAVLEPATPIGG